MSGSWKNWIQNSGSLGNASNSFTIKPLWTVNLEDDESILKWHDNVVDTLEPIQDRAASMYERGRDLYSGDHHFAKGRASSTRDPASGWGTANFKHPEIVVNHCYELTEQWVSKLSRFSANVDILPVNSDEGDRSKARGAQKFADYLAEVNDFKGMLLDRIRDMKIGGESYIFIDYDDEVGDLKPDAKKAKELGIRVPLLDDSGEKMFAEDGTQLFIEERARVGDLVYRPRSRPEVCTQPKRRWKDVEWIREDELVDVNEVKRKYPKSAFALNETPSFSNKTGDHTGRLEAVEEVLVSTYWHKGVAALDSGRKIVLVENAVLFNGPNPFSGAPLPVVRLTDVDVEGDLHGKSFLDNIFTLQLALNQLYSLWFRNIALGSHLYWLVPASARIQRDKIRNSASVIQYFGNVKPEIAVFKTVSADLMQLIDKIEQRILTISRIQSTSRGELPPNVEAGVAIGILEQQEQQSATPDIKKINAAVEKLFKISLGIAGDKYEADDGRTVRILGTEGEFVLQQLDSSKLSGPFDIKVKKTTALSENKALMTKEITQLIAMKPDVFSNERIYDLMDLGDTDKFYDIATAALRAAEYENDQLRDEEEVAEPTSDEYLLVHWLSHMTMAQTPSFKSGRSDIVKENLEDHILATEFLLIEKAKKNISLATALAKEMYFPAYYQPDFSIPQILTMLQQGNDIPLIGETDEAEPGQASILPDNTSLTPDEVGDEPLPVGPEQALSEQALPSEQGGAQDQLI